MGLLRVDPVWRVSCVMLIKIAKVREQLAGKCENFKNGVGSAKSPLKIL